MLKIAFMGAGSTTFAKNILGDCMLSEPLRDAELSLYDIDKTRLDDSRRMLENLNRNINKDRATITAHHGVRSRRKALRGADFVVNAVQVGGYKPGTVIDFEIPKKYGLRQTIADTLGIGGIFRALRTIPVVDAFARDIEKECPDAWFLNYVNPMAMITGHLQRHTSVRTVGLCHSVQVCASSLLKAAGLAEKYPNPRWQVAGINHMAWLLKIEHEGRDLYPEIKKEAARRLKKWRRSADEKSHNMVRLAMMLHFGYYMSESSEHNAEYSPYWIKNAYPELVEEFNIPIDEYIRRCEGQIKRWAKLREDLVENKDLEHKRTHEYGSQIMEAIVTDTPLCIYGNVINTGLIPNLPAKACVEVPCMVDRNGVQACHLGELPEQCAALNRTNVNVQLLTIEAARTGSRDKVYQAAMLDPHTAAELSLDDIRAMCDELIEAHGDYLPTLR